MVDVSTYVFDVYIGVMGLEPTKENRVLLNARQAVDLARGCTQRVAATEVKIVCAIDDTITFHWKNGNVIFP